MVPSSRVRLIAVVLAVAGALGAAAMTIQPKRAKCVATPVPGQPGVQIVACAKRA